MALDFELSEEHQLAEKTVRDAMLPWTERRAELREMTRRAELILDFVSEWDLHLPRSY
jgi:hypothetical protein